MSGKKSLVWLAIFLLIGIASGYSYTSTGFRAPWLATDDGTFNTSVNTYVTNATVNPYNMNASNITTGVLPNVSIPLSAANLSANNTFTGTGNTSFAGNVTAKQIGGVIYADKYATIQDALNQGGHIRFRGTFTGVGQLNITKSNTYLDGYTANISYTATTLFNVSPNLRGVRISGFNITSTYSGAAAGVNVLVLDSWGGQTDFEFSDNNITLINYNPGFYQAIVSGTLQNGVPWHKNVVFKNNRFENKNTSGGLDNYLSGITINRYVSLKIQDNQWYDINNPIYTGTLTDNNGSFLEYSGNYEEYRASAMHTEGIDLEGIDHVKIFNNVQNNTVTLTNAHGAGGFGGAGTGNVTNVEIYSNTQICLTGGGTWGAVGGIYGVRGLNIHDNTYIDMGQCGGAGDIVAAVWLANGAVNKHQDIQIHHNRFENTKFWAVRAENARRLDVSHNQINKSGYTGIELFEVNNSLVNANRIHNAAADTSQTNWRNGILLYNTYNTTVKDNQIWDTNTTTGLIYGIREQNTGDYNEIYDNVLPSPHVTSALGIIGTNTTAKNNMWVAPYSWGSKASAPTAFGFGDEYSNSTSLDFTCGYTGTQWQNASGNTVVC